MRDRKDFFLFYFSQKESKKSENQKIEKTPGPLFQGRIRFLRSFILPWKSGTLFQGRITTSSLNSGKVQILLYPMIIFP